MSHPENVKVEMYIYEDLVDGEFTGLVKCNSCGSVFYASRIPNKYKDGEEFCPVCLMEGCLQDIMFDKEN